MSAPRVTYRTSLFVKKTLFQFSCGCEKFHSGRSFGFIVINVCNHGEHYETSCNVERCMAQMLYAGYLRLQIHTQVV